ncbi:hypothetical protein QCA50_008846 [Cerrena zonata]|uniref:DUF6533 domain-containing protein n=1 Tax=Cerrena zonata TaxID=2478898 RepID=A0AAW0G7Y2_9APHY
MSSLAGTDLTLLSHIQLRTYFDGEIYYISPFSPTETKKTVAAITIIWYDYFLTLNDEISLFWGRPRSWMVSLFFLNRYLILILQTYNLYPQLALHISPKNLRFDT